MDDKQTGKGTRTGADGAKEVSLYEDGQRVGVGARWLPPAEVAALQEANARVRPGGERPVGPWRLVDGVEREEISEEAAAAIAQSLGLSVPTFE